MLNRSAPDDGGGDQLQVRSKLGQGLGRRLGLGDDSEGEASSSLDSKTSPLSVLQVGGEGGRSFCVVGVWNGTSVGWTCLQNSRGLGQQQCSLGPNSDKSSMSIIGGVILLLPMETMEGYPLQELSASVGMAGVSSDVMGVSSNIQEMGSLRKQHDPAVIDAE